MDFWQAIGTHLKKYGLWYSILGFVFLSAFLNALRRFL